MRRFVDSTSSKYSRCCGAGVDKIFTGLATNETAVFQATIYSYNLKGRSERVKLPKMTLDAEECCHAAVSHHYLVQFPNFDIYTSMNATFRAGFMYMCPKFDNLTFFSFFKMGYSSQCTILMSKLMDARQNYLCCAS